ncbi:MAG: hypothetical protein MMC33_002970 [Icmadophila ericetorum]|nr:hypothetical protein [Icmadophila ericetorum]
MTPNDKPPKQPNDDHDNGEQKPFFLDALIYDLSKGLSSVVSDIKAVTLPSHSYPYNDEERKEARAASSHSFEKPRWERDSIGQPERRRIQDYIQQRRKDEEQRRLNEEEVQVSMKTYKVDPEDDMKESAGLLCPYRPRQSGTGSEQQTPANQVSQSTSFFTYPWTQWQQAFLLMSRYSPLHLEQHDSSALSGIRWREAFEDLLAVTSGEQMADKYNKREELSKTDWLEYMRRQANARYANTADLLWSNPAHPTHPNFRGVTFKFQMGRKEDDDGGEGEEEEEEEEKKATELDLYEHFLGSQSPPSPPQEPSSRKSGLSTTPNPVVAPSSEVRDLQIVSTLTTTERTTMPDGTTRTRMVLKKRFADGREESNETVYTIQAQGSHKGDEKEDGMKRLTEHASDSNDKGKEKERKGWFWN